MQHRSISILGPFCWRAYRLKWDFNRVDVKAATIRRAGVWNLDDLPKFCCVLQMTYSCIICHPVKISPRVNSSVDGPLHWQWFNSLNPVYDVATICRQVRCIVHTLGALSLSYSRVSFELIWNHRGEAMYISLIDFHWTSTETKSFQ